MLSLTLHEIKAVNLSRNHIKSIVLTSETDAWIYADNSIIKAISAQNIGKVEVESRIIPSMTYFTVLRNGDLITTDSEKKVIRRYRPDGKKTTIAITKPLLPRWISKTQTDDILVTMRDDGDDFTLKPSSRRLVQRMSPIGNVLHTYEFQRNGRGKLFTLPHRTVENENSELCVLNSLNENDGELVILQQNGDVRCIYCGIDDPRKFDPVGIACDPKGKIIVVNITNNTLHLLSPEGDFWRYFTFKLDYFLFAIALRETKLWIGFYCGIVKVYEYTE